MKSVWLRALEWGIYLVSLIVLTRALLPTANQGLDWTTTSIIAVFIALLHIFPFPIGQTHASLAHALTLPLALTHGFAEPALALLVGTAAGAIVRAVRSSRRNPERLKPALVGEMRTGSLIFGQQLLSLTAALGIFRTLGGVRVVDESSLTMGLPLIGFTLSFSISFILLVWISGSLEIEPAVQALGVRELLLVSLLPIPFAVITAVSTVYLGILALILWGGTLAAISPTLQQLFLAERDLGRRLQELSTLSRVSHAMRTSLDLEALLETIYLQVTHLLGVNSFYIALSDPHSREISYPLAVKDGSRQHWPNRPMEDRLTDRVIQTASPILIVDQAAQRLQEMGFTDLHNPPECWLGVPLISPGRAFGCLAVFHTQPATSLTNKDQEILTTLAGQAAVAIENALLYEQTRRRADALASLNEITTSMGASLDPEKTLELVSRSMTQVGGGQKSAIYLVDQNQGILYLAWAANVSKKLEDAIRRIPLDDAERTRAFNDQTPVLIPNLEESSYPRAFVQQLVHEGVYAIIDLPLITPSGTIGMASVYFAEPQHFRPDQVHLLQTFTAQAALAVANARAHAETDQELKRRVEQLSMLEASGRKMVSTLDPDELFGTILEHALKVTGGETGHLSVFEAREAGLRIAASRGYEDESKLFAPEYRLPTDQGITGTAFHAGELVNVANVEPGSSHEDWMNEGTQSLLCIPLLRWGQRIGLITVESPRPSAFKEGHEQALRQVAAQASIALTNSSLYQQLEARLREQSLLYQASVHLAATLEAGAVAMAAADSLALALSAERVRIYRWVQSSRHLQLQASVEEGRPIDDEQSDSVSVVDAPAFATSLKEGTPIQWSSSDAPTRPDREYLVGRRDAASLLAIPLRVGDQTLGLVEVLSQKQRLFDENEIRTAQTLSSQAAIAFQNAELFVHLRESHERLLAVLNSTQAGMLMVDPSGTIVVANHQLEVLTGLQVDSVVGRDLNTAGSELASRLGYRSGELANLMAALRSGEALSGDETTFEVERPIQRAFLRTGSPVHDSNQLPIGWLIVLRDISEERNLVRAREQLTEMIVHDLRSPLTTILGSLKLLERSFSKESSQVIAQALTISNRSCEQMLGLVNSLLDIAKLESGEFQLSSTSVSLSALCKDLIDIYVHEANEQGILLEHTITSKLPRISADEEKLRRVLDNILDNALKFTPPGGRIRVDVEPDTSFVNISIADTGPGVPDELKETIFERFVQGQPGLRHGTGLGLAFSKLAVEAHGGSIWVEDNAGGGSIFRIRLPRNAASEQAEKGIDVRATSP